MKAELPKKVGGLKEVANVITEMPHTHEAFAMLWSCADVCRVTYLLRTAPPRQIEDFTRAFDEILKKGSKDPRHQAF